MDRHHWWFLDLLGMVLYAGVVAAAVLTGVGGMVRLLLVVPLVAFVPGYALLAAVYPRSGDLDALPPFDAGADASTRTTSAPDDFPISGVGRFVLSVAASFAITPVVGVLAAFTPWAIAVLPVLAGLCGLTVLLAVLAGIARLRADPRERFAVSPGIIANGLHALVTGPDSSSTGTDRALSAVLVASMLLLVASGGYAAVTPANDEPFTEFYLVTDEPGGGGSPPFYASELSEGQPQQYTVALTNHENERVDYTVVVQLQRIDGGNDNPDVEERHRLETFEPSVAAGETWVESHELTPDMVGDDLRIVYLLYKGDAPAEPTAENAYRTLSMPVNVSGSGDLSPPTDGLIDERGGSTS